MISVKSRPSVEEFLDSLKEDEVSIIREVFLSDYIRRLPDESEIDAWYRYVPSWYGFLDGYIEGLYEKKDSSRA